MSTKRRFRGSFEPHVRFSLSFEGVPSRTKQQFQEECDINGILARYAKLGVISHFSSQSPKYGDFISVPDYQSSMNQIIAVRESFDALPSKIRERFDNDPVKFLEFVSNPENRDEARFLGMLKPEELSTPEAKRPQGAGEATGVGNSGSGGVPTGTVTPPSTGS